MNFYKRHLGDIAKGCAHLSQGQMGAYDLLLDWIYGNERPLPTDKADLYRIGRASNKAERDNVDRVIAEFFEKTSEGYTQKRATAEIARADHQRTVNREIGKLGGRRKQTESVSESVSEPKPNDNPSQTPDSRQEQNQKHAESVPAVINLPTPAPTGTEAGRACVLMRNAGCGITNPSHPDLLAALAAGVTPEALADAAAEAVQLRKSKPFAWAIATAHGRLDETATRPGASHDRARESLADRNARRAAEIIGRIEQTERIGAG